MLCFSVSVFKPVTQVQAKQVIFVLDEEMLFMACRLLHKTDVIHLILGFLQHQDFVLSLQSSLIDFTLALLLLK